MRGRRRAHATVTRASGTSRTGTKPALHTTLITPYGVKRNKYWGEVQSEVTLEDLFQ
jgi:hypothetical protein